MTHIERFGPFGLIDKIEVAGKIVDFYGEGENFYIWSMISKKCYVSEYWIAVETAPLEGDHYLRSFVVGGAAFHLMRTRSGGNGEGSRNEPLETENQKSDIDNDEGDQLEVLVEDGDQAVGATDETVEVGQSVPGEEGSDEDYATRPV